jgi:hypothetical protein
MELVCTARAAERLSVLLTAEDEERRHIAAMGEDVSQDGRTVNHPRLVAHVHGTQAIDSVTFYRDGRILHVAQIAEGARAGTVAFTDTAAPRGLHDYWVRVVQKSERGGVRACETIDGVDT